VTKLLAMTTLALALCATATGSASRNVDVPRTFAAQLAKVKRTTRVPVLLPPTLPLIGNYKLYPSLYGVSQKAFQLELAGAPDCYGANACFVAMFRGERGGRLPGRPNVRLANGEPAFFHPVSCGGSCAPNSFWFEHSGYLYTWQAKDLRAPEKAALTRMANQAIAAGPR
jgi:hypothetical protein